MPKRPKENIYWKTELEGWGYRKGCPVLWLLPCWHFLICHPAQVFITWDIHSSPLHRSPFKALQTLCGISQTDSCLPWSFLSESAESEDEPRTDPLQSASGDGMMSTALKEPNHKIMPPPPDKDKTASSGFCRDKHWRDTWQHAWQINVLIHKMELKKSKKYEESGSSSLGEII